MNVSASLSKNPSRHGRMTLLVLLLYAGLALLITWPALANLTTHLIGGRNDLWTHQWTFWWVKEALAAGRSPFYTDMLYAPLGAPLFSHNFAWLNIALWLPLQAIVGDIAAYNITILLILLLNGFSMYLLARELMPRRFAALWPV